MAPGAGGLRYIAYMKLLLPLCLLLAGGLQAQPASVAGTVIDQTTGQPLRGAHVRLITGDFGENGINAVYGAMTDANGRFSSEGMKPGFYIVVAERAGFLQAPTADAPMPFLTLGLKAGQHLDDFKIAMAARATISGRVVDEYGDSVEGLSVEAKVPPPGKQQETITGNRNVNTDDRGEFRLVVSPGKYFVRASSFEMGMGVGWVGADGSAAPPFAATYFPGATDESAASVIQLSAGQDVAGIEIRLARSTNTQAARHGHSIGGVVTGIPENATATVHLKVGENTDQMYDTQSTSTDPSGKFSMMGLQPGYYSVTARYTGGKMALQSRPVSVHLENSDEPNLQLALAPGEDLNGSLAFAGGEASRAPGALAVRLETPERFGQDPEPPAAQVGKDGSFRIANVLPGKFKVVVEPMPDNAYVKELALDGKPVTDTSVDFSQGVGGAHLKITIGLAGAKISGRILDKNGEPDTGFVSVFIATDAKQIDEENAKRVSDGNYSFDALAPGKYHLFALDMLQLISAFAGDGNEDEMMKKFFDAAEVIEIKEGDRIQKDINAFIKLPEKK